MSGGGGDERTYRYGFGVMLRSAIPPHFGNAALRFKGTPLKGILPLYSLALAPRSFDKTPLFTLEKTLILKRAVRIHFFDCRLSIFFGGG